ncbi:MAG: hypothetical protein KKC20_21615 [Proteobacteria bacterium]|nr:hypothetical protein [Pseudomonadota bacterium]
MSAAQKKYFFGTGVLKQSGGVLKITRLEKRFARALKKRPPERGSPGTLNWWFTRKDKFFILSGTAKFPLKVFI